MGTKAMRKYILQFSIRNLLRNPPGNNPKISKAFNDTKNRIKNGLNMYYFITICFFIFFAFMRLFLLFQEPDYKAIIDYGERGTILIATLAILTFAYAVALELPEREKITKIGKYFLKSVLNFVIGLIFLLGFSESWKKPPDLSVFPGILFSLFPSILVILSLIVMLIFLFAGLGMLILSAFYLGRGLYGLTKSL